MVNKNPLASSSLPAREGSTGPNSVGMNLVDSLQSSKASDADDKNDDKIIDELSAITSALGSAIAEITASNSQTDCNSNTQATNPQVSSTLSSTTSTHPVAPHAAQIHNRLEPVNRPIVSQNIMPNLGTSTSHHKSDLISQIPPLPTKHGQLPPMPPPPAALTHPPTYLTGINKRSEKDLVLPNIDHIGDLSRIDLDKLQNIDFDHLKRLDHLDLELPSSYVSKPTPEQPAKLSESREKSLLGEINHEFNNPDESDPNTDRAFNKNSYIMLTRQKSLPVLDSLAAQILDSLSGNHFQDTLATVTQSNSERGLSYRILLDAFEDVKRLYFPVYSPKDLPADATKPIAARPFLEYDIKGVELNRENMITIQMANLATFVAAIFGTIEIGFWELEKWFIKVFVPKGGRLLKQQANIYLDLKTQAYIAAIEATDDVEKHKEALEELFPPNFETKLHAMFDERIALSPTERDFVAKCQRRRENIESEQTDELPIKYHWVPFLREISDYVQRNHHSLANPRKLTVDQQSQMPLQRNSLLRKPVLSKPTPASNTSLPTTERQHSPAKPMDSITPHRASAEPESTKQHTAPVSSSVVNKPVTVPVSPAAPAKILSSPSIQSSSSLQSGSVSGESVGSTQSNPARPLPDISMISPEGHPMFPPLPKQVLPASPLSLL